MRLKKAGNLTVTQFSVSEIPLDDSHQDIIFQSQERRQEYESPSPVREMPLPREEIKEEIKEELELEMDIVKSPTPRRIEQKQERLIELNADLVQPKTPNQRPPKYS